MAAPPGARVQYPIRTSCACASGETGILPGPTCDSATSPTTERTMACRSIRPWVRRSVSRSSAPMDRAVSRFMPACGARNSAMQTGEADQRNDRRARRQEAAVRQPLPFDLDDVAREALKLVRLGDAGAVTRLRALRRGSPHFGNRAHQHAAAGRAERSHHRRVASPRRRSRNALACWTCCQSRPTQPLPGRGDEAQCSRLTPPRL